MIAATFAPREASSSEGVSNNSGTHTITLRKADYPDLVQINTLIAAAMDTWRLSKRVKRLCLPLYQYDVHDLEHLQIIVVETDKTSLTGVAAIEVADATECPRGHDGALLHGIYVDPLLHNNGIGTRLLIHMQLMASSEGYRGLLVKANPEATSFFEARDFKKLPVEDPSRDYPYRYWKSF